MADNIEPISHLEKVITGDAEPISHLEQVIALYGGGSGGVDSGELKKLDNKIEALKTAKSLEYEGEDKICNNTLASRTSDMFIKGKTYINLGTGGLESAGEKENKISILSNNNKSEDDVNYKEDKKEILLPVKGGLKSLPNEVCDTIEQRNDGVYLVQKIDKYDIKENDEIKIDSPPNQHNTIAFSINVNAKNIKTSGNNICNNFNRFTSGDLYWNSDKEGILNSTNSQFKFRILKSKLSTQDIAGIKAWLKANPTTVCYEINTPVETKLDINNLDLEVYEGTTCITTDNTIQPTLSFKVPSNMGGVIQENAQNINKLYKLSDEGVKKTDITTTINSASTDIQVPSAKSVYDKSKNKINEMSAIDITTYADSIASGGVTETIRIYNSINSPYGSGNTSNDFYYTIYTMSDSINYIRVIAYDVRKNNMYMIMKYEGTWGSWQRLCTTSVEDMSPSEISSFVDTDVSGVMNYRVKNGICFVKIWGVQSKTAGKSKFLLNDSSMPIPNCFDTGNALFEANGDGTANAFAFVDNKGALIVHFYKANSEAYGSFSYPVAE